MNYEGRLENVSVLGAAGKMGSGIVLLASMEMARLNWKPENRNRRFTLHAIDTNQKAFSGLMRYLKTQSIKSAERIIGASREVRAEKDASDNSAAGQFADAVMNIVRTSTDIGCARESHIVFEAASEDPDIKTEMLARVNESTNVEPWFFTNTSSIPIGYLDKRAGLDGKILGVHFYNPPAVQKLVEVAEAKTSKPEPAEFAGLFIRNTRKVEIRSADVAGFIGNGHFIRDALHGMSVADKLERDFSFPEAVYMANRVGRDFMIRPMGIFQLMDYVGLDVCRSIMKIMNHHLKDEMIHSPLLDELVATGVKGGRDFEGSQQDGFLKYEEGRPVAVFDVCKKSYTAISGLADRCDRALGPLPEKHVPWKDLAANKEKDAVLREYFRNMRSGSNTGAVLALDYMRRSGEIGKKLVEDGVARNAEDVNTVLLTGFAHAYGPINDYLDP